MSTPCLAERLKYFIDLTDAEIDALGELERAPRDYDAGETIFAEGDDADTLYVVKKGWLHSSNTLADGKRQILRLHYPGDILGTASIAFEEASATVVTGGEVRLCRFPQSALGTIFQDHPRLGALFYAVGMLENVSLADRLKCLGSSTGKGRLAAFLLEILSRLRTMQDDEKNAFEIPLTQADIGDAVGLTQIHVNRLFSQLEKDDEAILRKGRRIEILREDYLTAISGFTDRYHSIDTSWFPPSSGE